MCICLGGGGGQWQMRGKGTIKMGLFEIHLFNFGGFVPWFLDDMVIRRKKLLFFFLRDDS